MPKSRAAQWAVLLAVSVAVAAPLQWAGLPAALLLGPMLAGIALGITGARIRVPRAAFGFSQAIVGCLVARAITGGIVATVLRDWPEMLAIVAVTIVQAGAISWLFVRFGSLPGTVAAWGLSPGAASAMVSMAEDYGADPRLVAFMQYLRVVCVVISASILARLFAGHQDVAAALPAAEATANVAATVVQVAATLLLAAVGGYLGRLFKVPAGAFLTPMVIGAVLHATGLLDITLPRWLLASAYAGIGWYVGLRFTRETVGHALRAVPQILAATLAMICLGAASAWLLTMLLGTDYLTAFLATSPGGLDSVAIISVGSDVDVPFILALQAMRLFLVILTGPAVARFVSRTAPRPVPPKGL